MRMQEQSRALEPIYIPESVRLITFHTMVDIDHNNQKTYGVQDQEQEQEQEGAVQVTKASQDNEKTTRLQEVTDLFIKIIHQCCRQSINNRTLVNTMKQYNFYHRAFALRWRKTVTMVLKHKHLIVDRVSPNGLTYKFLMRIYNPSSVKLFI